MSMADRIKERRIIMGYTQEELGLKLGLQKSAIAKYENGRVENIKRSIIAKMAEVLDCSPCYLLDWENDSEKTESEAFGSKYIALIKDEACKMNLRGQLKLLDTAREMNCNPLYNNNYETELAAAHRRTDIEVTDEMIKHDDDIMDDDDF